MLVEDDAGHTRLIERVLEKAGLANPIVMFHDGEEAFAYLEGRGRFGDRDQHPVPVLMLLDNHLPSRSGLDILAWLRKDPELQKLPVVMLSGSSDSEDIFRAFELGVDTYLVKPVAFDALLDAINGLGLPWAVLARSDRG
ncbi:MAG: response regulator [Actinomycetota bacterium]|jgi:DNA-binding response OmpR family regulator